MTKKLLILDKDGTLVIPASGEPFPTGPSDQKLISESIPHRINQYRAAGYEVAIATNQGGVAAGHKTLGSAIDEVMFAMDLCGVEYALLAPSYEEKFGEAVWIDKSDGGQFIKTITNGAVRFRKPAPGMIGALALRIYGTDPCEVLMVGDMDSDRDAALAAGVRFMWAKDFLTEFPTTAF